MKFVKQSNPKNRREIIYGHNHDNYVQDDNDDDDDGGDDGRLTAGKKVATEHLLCKDEIEIK